MTTDVSAAGRGRGKLIVFGEHSVVYGHPAVACSLARGARARIRRADTPRWSIDHPGGTIPVDDAVRTAGRNLLSRFDLDSDDLHIEIELTIPVGVGLGSSAAMAVALARGAARLADRHIPDARSDIAAAVDASEAVFHGTPSGIDRRAATGSGFFRFQTSGSGPDFSALDVDSHSWIVAHVGPSMATADMVRAVAKLRDRRPRILASLFDDFRAVADDGIQAISAGDWAKVGELMNINQGLLNAIGVSTPRLEAACTAARDAGALGAKLTGAGGGGCIVALPHGDNVDDVRQALDAYGDVYRFELPAEPT